MLPRASIHYAASKAKEKIRINSLKLLHFDSRDEQIIQESFQQVSLFGWITITLRFDRRRYYVRFEGGAYRR